ncbi:hypothetical protein BE08_26850 [Sorangium cellulosum]|uniref:Cytochrome c domain-containing protein n=1 Tax=Sorangium cellulosum TaxID=56 RepID=A0A150PPF0_SORCE|nr:hypothetical protein BE08_26850 [Sorangium cellulosum]
MRRSTTWVGFACWAGAALFAAGCAAPADDADVYLDDTSQPVTLADRIARCEADPRVVAGLVSRDVCAGAGVFFEETFEGNGRTCGTCHPAANSTTLDIDFVTALDQSNPDDPLFVFRDDPALAALETSDLLEDAAILENVDGFIDPERRFVSRGVNHVLSLSTSIQADPGDGTTVPPAERTGWGGDGSSDGTLRGFLRDAVAQHFPRRLDREVGVDFRLPTPQEEDVALAFQLSLGRQNELDLSRVRLHDAQAEEGRLAFMDPHRGRCNVCHNNAGANFQDTGRNRNFDTGTRSLGSPLNVGSFEDWGLSDGGFGGRDLPRPDFDSGSGFPDAFGNGTFNTPPLIEAADTPPFFHNSLQINSRGTRNIEDAVTFYASASFKNSPAALELDQRFGAPLDLVPMDSLAIARFLRALNGAFNVDIARQRLDAARVLVSRFANTRADVQVKLMELAREELDDAIAVMGDPNNPDPLYPAALQQLGLARAEIDQGISAGSASERQNRITNAIARVATARAQFGEGITFALGQGNLMY